MTIYSLDFIYAGHSSEEYGVKLGFIQNIDRASNEEKTEIKTSKNLFQETWNFHGTYPSEPLTFKICVFNEDGTMIDADKQEDLKNWLIRDEYAWLSIDQIDLYDKQYFCIINNPSFEDVGMQNAGFTFQCTCDSNHAWSPLQNKPYTSNTTINFDLFNYAKYNKYIILPALTISPTSNGNISIVNNTTNKTVTINNCVSTETIYLDCKTGMIKSTNGRIMLDSWNKNILELKQGKNNITLNGAFTIKFEYRIPVRIGG